MKVFIVLSALIAAVSANGLLDAGYGGHYAAAPIVTKVANLNTGHSTQSRSQDAWGNYAFAYEEQNNGGPWGISGGSSRQESGDAWGNKKGSYSLNVGDGRQRVVKYVADGAGFRAAISTNEPGTAAQPAADTSISSPNLPVAAPIAHPQLVSAPLAVAATHGEGLAYGGLASGAALGYGNGLALGNGAGLGAGLALGNHGGLAYAGNLGAGYGAY